MNKNYRVIGADRRSSRDSNWRHDFLKISNKMPPTKSAKEGLKVLGNI